MTSTITKTPSKRPKRPSYYVSPLRYRLLRAFGDAVLHILFRIETSGEENVPQSGSVVFASNHLHLFDPFAVAPRLRRQPVTLIAAKWRSHFLVRSVLSWAGVIYVRRGEVDRRALRQCLEVLRSGGALGIAPEGTRSKTGALQEGKPGIAYLAARTETVIVPVVSWGLEQLKHWSPFKRPILGVAVGEPFYLPKLEGRRGAEEMRVLGELVMIQVARLLPERYRGVYSERVAEAEAGLRQGPTVVFAHERTTS